MEHCRLTKYVCRRQFHFVPMKTTKRRHDYFRFIDKEIGPKEVCAFPRLCLRFMEEEDLNTGCTRPLVDVRHLHHRHRKYCSEPWVP